MSAKIRCQLSRHHLQLGVAALPNRRVTIRHDSEVYFMSSIAMHLYLWHSRLDQRIGLSDDWTVHQLEPLATLIDALP